MQNSSEEIEMLRAFIRAIPRMMVYGLFRRWRKSA